MAFATIYARNDGTFKVVMGGAITETYGGSGRWISRPFRDEQAARQWIRDGVQKYGIPDMPPPKVIRNGKVVKTEGDLMAALAESLRSVRGPSANQEPSA